MTAWHHPDALLHAKIAEAIESGRPAAHARIIATKGHVPREVGTGMLIYADGTFEGTIGGGTFEASVILDATAALAAGTSTTETYELKQKTLGMYCQGEATVFIDVLSVRRRLVIFGAGHVGQALARVAAATGLFSLTIVDDRQPYLELPGARAADRRLLVPTNFTADLPEVGSADAVCIVTRCHDVDKALLRALESTPPGFLGMIGSTTKWKVMARELRDEGVASSYLERVRCPIGLYRSGKAPAEIAVSILAEILAPDDPSIEGEE